MRAATGLVATALVFLTTAAHADDPKKEAGALFTQGLKRSESGDARGALAAFRSAYEKFPNFRVLYNIGRLCSGLGDAVCAVRSYEQYLKDGASEVPAKRRKEVEGDLEKLALKVGKVTVTSNVDGAELAIDDAPSGKTPFAAPFVITPGKHVLVLVHDGTKVDRTVQVAAGESPTIELPFRTPAPPRSEAAIPIEREAEPTPPETSSSPSPEPVAEAPAKERRRFPVVPWAIAGGAAVATAITGVLAAGAYANFGDAKDRLGVTRSELDDSQSSARTLFLITGGLAAVTVVAGGVASYFTWIAPGTRARVGVGPAGVSLTGALP